MRIDLVPPPRPRTRLRLQFGQVRYSDDHVKPLIVALPEGTNATGRAMVKMDRGDLITPAATDAMDACVSRDETIVFSFETLEDAFTAYR